jgi:hypothetical protein
MRKGIMDFHLTECKNFLTRQAGNHFKKSPLLPKEGLGVVDNKFLLCRKDLAGRSGII